MESSLANDSSQAKENQKLSIHSFSSTFQSSTNTKPLQDISNRNFSLNEILPSPQKDSKFSHRRFSSQAFDLLNPRWLFSSNPSKFSQISRVSSETFRHKDFIKRNIHDCDDFNRTSPSPLNRKSLESQESAEKLPQIFVRVSQNMRFCMNCDKIVEIREEVQGSRNERKSFQFLCVLVACWQPTQAQQDKIEMCIECGFAIL